MKFALGFINGNLPIVNNFGIFRLNKVNIGLKNEQHEIFLEYKRLVPEAQQLLELFY